MSEVGMSEERYDSDEEARRHALWALHHLGGGIANIDPGRVPRYSAPAAAAALRTLTDATEEELPHAARLQVLHRLARKGFPGRDTAEAEYRGLIESVAAARGISADQLQADLEASALQRQPFAATGSAKGLSHRDTAFIDQEVCTIRSVIVDGLPATWIYSEFETDAAFDHVAAWVDPRNWPKRGPMMFKGMSLVGSPEPVPIKGLGTEHWHGVFHEDVQLVQRVNTLLHCDFWRDGDRAAGMTYDLDLSLDSEIDVDRGYLLVVDTGAVRRVQALKVVGFTTDAWDDVAALVCPFWTDWVRGAVEGGSASQPVPGTVPSGTGTPANPTADTFEAWLQFFGDSARGYLDLAGDIGSRVSAGSYSTSDWLADGSRTWSQLAQDWATAWRHGLDALAEVADQGLDAGLMPPGTPHAAGRGAATAMVGSAAAGAGSRGDATTVPLPDPAPPDQPVCSALVSIEAGGATIPPEAVAVTVVDLPDGGKGARIATTNRSLPAGLYVGELRSAAGNALAPVQLYLARAAGAGGP
jgi:hypothetical protein